MKVAEWLKRINRTLLEMHLGILFCGIVCQLAGAFWVKEQAVYAASLWFGILFAAISAYHMYSSMDRALDFDEKTATKMIYRAYAIRYAAVVVIFAIIMLTEVLNPLVVFMAYMSLKVTAYLQPITHKLCNKLFHETDPIPQPLEEEPIVPAQERTVEAVLPEEGQEQILEE